MLLQMAKFHSFVCVWLSIISLHMYTTPSLSIHLLIKFLGSFHVLAIIYTAAMNTGVHVSFQIIVFFFFLITLRSGNAGSYGQMLGHILIIF